MEQILKRLRNIRFANPKNTTLLVILLLIITIMTILMPRSFPSARNITSMASQFPEFGFLALAMMCAMITGGIDLSVVAVANFTGVLAALILSGSTMGTMPTMVLAVVVIIIMALVCGALNGSLIAFLGVPPILATLGTQGLFMGLAIVLTRGHSISGFPVEFLVIGNGYILGVPISFIMFVVASALIYLVLTKTKQGFSMFMYGTSSIVSRFSGIDNRKVIIKTYMISALLAGMSAIIMISRTNSMRPGYGAAYLLQAILVVVLGGVDPDGGFGDVYGVIMAIIILQVTQSGLNLMAFSPFFRRFIWGFALLLVMVLNYLLDKRRVKKQILEKNRAKAATPTT